MANGLRKRVVKNKLKTKKQSGKNLYGIKQGVGATTRKAFPGGLQKRSIRNRQAAVYKNALNAMHPSHLPLPRAVGAYTTIRTTDIINSDAAALLFGTFKGPASQFTETSWVSTIAVASRNPALSIGSNNNGGNATFFGSSALEAPAISGARMVPAAITVQIMNGQALQSADGIAYIGRAKTVLDLMGDLRTWNTVMQELVSYSAPRLCSGGKLALRGVQVNAVPNNMSVLSDFVPRRIPDNGTQQWSEDVFPLDFEGFGPIFVYNPDAIPLKYLVTIEWRMRFDPLNPAYAGHIMHQPASESTWTKVIGDAEAAGHGVMDIADVAADVGAVALGVAPYVM